MTKLANSFAYPLATELSDAELERITGGIFQLEDFVIAIAGGGYNGMIGGSLLGATYGALGGTVTFPGGGTVVGAGGGFIVGGIYGGLAGAIAGGANYLSHL